MAKGIKSIFTTKGFNIGSLLIGLSIALANGNSTLGTDYYNPVRNGKLSGLAPDKPSDGGEGKEQTAYRMHIRKDFGNTLRKDTPQAKVYARIVKSMTAFSLYYKLYYL